MIEVLPFFHDLILHSNMISQGKFPRSNAFESSEGLFQGRLLPSHLINYLISVCRQQARQGLLGLQPQRESKRGGPQTKTQAQEA